MALERSTWKFGGVTFPLTDATTNALVTDGDPVIEKALAYFKKMLETYLGDRWAAECALCGLDDIEDTIVANVAHYDPQPHLREQQFKFPLLAMFRSSEQYSYKNHNRTASTEQHTVLWVMPPLTSAQMERMAPFIKLVTLVLQNRTEEGGDAAYESAQRVWSVVNIDEIQLMNATYGLWDGGAGMPFPGVNMQFLVSQQTDSVTGAFDPVDRMDTSIDLEDVPTDTTVTDVVIVRNED